MKKIALVTLALSLVACNQPADNAGQRAETALTQQALSDAAQIKSLLLEAGDQVDEVVLVSNDFKTGYSTKKGIVDINYGLRVPGTNYVRFRNGNEVRVPDQDEGKLQPQALTCEPFVQLKTIQQYSGVSSKIKLTPSVYGLDQARESTYAYVGLYTSPVITQGGRTEAGFFMQYSPSYDPGVYHAYLSLAATATTQNVWMDSTYDLIGSGFEAGIAKGTNARVTQKVLKVPGVNGTDSYKVSTTWEVLNSTGTSVVKSYTTVYPQTGSYFSSAAMNNMVAGRTTSYLSDTTNSGEGVFDQYWYDSQALSAYYPDGDVRRAYSYSAALITPTNTAVYSYGDVHDCYNQGLFTKSVAVLAANYSVKESIFAP